MTGQPTRKKISFDEFLKLPIDSSWSFKRQQPPAPTPIRSVRHTPEEFHRMLLRAKEGDINPAEADRATAKFTRKLARPQGPPPGSNR